MHKFKFFAGVLLAVLLLPLSAAYAGVGISVDGTNIGGTDHIDFVRGGTTAEQDGSDFKVPIVSDNLIATGTANGGATSMATSDLAVPIAYSYVRKAISNDSAFSAGTMADGEPGQRITIHIVLVQSGGTWTLTPSRVTGITSVTFTTAGQIASFLYVDDTDGWVLDGSTTATVNIP